MPTSKSSISTDPLHREAIQHMVDEGDYEQLLLTLLAVINRDGGQYTLLAGLTASFETAVFAVIELYRKNAALTARVGQLARGGQ